MFENDSQAMFVISFMVYRALPMLKIIAGILMSLSVYRHAKSNNISHKGIWAVVALGFPVLGRVAYCIYHRFIRKKKTEYLFEQVTSINNRKGTILCVLSLILSGLASIITVIAIGTMGVSVVKSIVDDEYIFEFTCYDVNGNKYSDKYQVPLLDRDGNTYEYDFILAGFGDYVDQNEKVFLGEHCYLDIDGYFVYLENEKLSTSEADWYEYYYDSDGNKYYHLEGLQIYWDENGNIYETRGRMGNKQLFYAEDF